MLLRLITAITPLIWGTTYIVTTDFLPPNSPILASIMRALPAGLLLLLIFRKLPKGLWWAKAVVLGVVNIGGFFAFLFMAATLLPGGVAAVVTNTSPLWVILLSPLFLGGRMVPIQLFGAVLAVIGVAALVLTPNAELNIGGVLAGLAASVCLAIGSILVKKWGTPEGVPMLAVTGWQLTIGGLVLIPFLPLEGLPEHVTWTNIGGWAYLIIFGALIAYALWFSGISKLPIVDVTILSILSPVVATILGVVVKHEQMSLVQWGGLVLVLASLLIVQVGGAYAFNRRRRQAKAKQAEAAAKD